MSQYTRNKKKEHQKLKKPSTTHVVRVSLPYKIETSDVMGRYLVATRCLEPGEHIIQEAPLAIGPTGNSEPVCLGCYMPVKLDLSQCRCSDCKWPICSVNCSGVEHENGHTTYECKVLKETNSAADLIAGASSSSIKNLYQLILPLRILLLKAHRPKDFEILLSMESHIKLRSLNTVLWKHYKETIVNKFIIDWNLKEFSEDDINHICGAIDVNCFEVGHKAAKAKALYRTSFLLAHDCVPNTSHIDHPKTFSMNVRTSRSIRKGEPITLSYGYTLQGTLKRRDFIYAGKFFWCQCKRCSDPTELETDCSALICPKCCKGSLRPYKPLDQDADWECDSCIYKLYGRSVVNLLDKINDDLESIDAHDIPGLEGFIKKYEGSLRPNHYLFLSAKYSLCQVYGRIEGYLINKMSLEDIQRKERYCREFLALTNVLEPCMSRLRGLIMYELHAPIMVLSTFLLKNKTISRNEFQRKMKEVASLLKNSRDILIMEPEGSTEYEMGLAADDALKSMGVV